MSFSPSFSPNGRDVVFSVTSRSNTDIYRLNIASNARSRLTSSISIDTAPSFSPDGSSLVDKYDNVIMLRTIGVVFSDDERRLTQYEK